MHEMALSLCRTALRPCFRRSDDRTHPNGSGGRLMQRHGSSAICSRASSLGGSQLLPLSARAPLRQLRRRSRLRPLASFKADRNSPTQQKGSKQLLDEVKSPTVACGRLAVPTTWAAQVARQLIAKLLMVKGPANAHVQYVAPHNDISHMHEGKPDSTAHCPGGKNPQHMHPHLCNL